MDKNTLIVNLFAGPGTGKSTVCAQLFSELKWDGISCEMALEFAKDKVWEESYSVLENQTYIFGKQLHRISRINKKVDVIITDAPLLFSVIYDSHNNKQFKEFVLSKFNEFNNFNIFLERIKEYKKEGRIQTLDEAKQIDNKVIKMLEENNINFLKLKAKKELAPLLKHKITNKITRAQN